MGFDFVTGEPTKMDNALASEYAGKFAGSSQEQAFGTIPDADDETNTDRQTQLGTPLLTTSPMQPVEARNSRPTKLVPPWTQRPS